MDQTELAARARAARESRTALHDGIVAAALDEMPQPAIAEATGLSIAQIRRIERAGGVPPRAAGRPRNTPPAEAGLPQAQKRPAPIRERGVHVLPHMSGKAATLVETRGVAVALPDPAGRS